jgi:hypothetical protein
MIVKTSVEKGEKSHSPFPKTPFASWQTVRLIGRQMLLQILNLLASPARNKQRFNQTLADTHTQTRALSLVLSDHSQCQLAKKNLSSGSR